MDWLYAVPLSEVKLSALKKDHSSVYNSVCTFPQQPICQNQPSK